MSTFTQWISGNWKEVIKWVVIGYVAWFATGLIQDLRRVERDAQRWEHSYNITVDNLNLMKRSYSDLKENADKLEARLLQRETELQSIASNLASIKGQINKLGNQNETIRKLLATVIPDQLWEQIWPANGPNGDQNGKDQDIRGTSTAIP